MKKIVIPFLIFFVIISFAQNNKGESMSKNIHDIKVKDISGKEVSLSDYEGKVLLIVNVASKCGYTKQYAGLQELYSKYKDKGFEILAFPCNDFGGQEPGTNKEIEEFCSTTFGVEFPLFDKIKVLGDDKEPLYEKLVNNPTTEQGDIKWNFEKFLIAKNGDVVARYRSKVEPLSDEIIDAVESELQK
jgi:glutathione peroxidase